MILQDLFTFYLYIFKILFSKEYNILSGEKTSLKQFSTLTFSFAKNLFMYKNHYDIQSSEDRFL